MKVIDRVNLVKAIAVELQKTMSTTQINTYLGGHNVPTEDTTHADSKRLYVEKLLKPIPENVVIQIGKELKLKVPEQASPNASYLSNLMDAHALVYCQTDFQRAVDTLASDPDQALGSACSLLESICKAILDKMHLGYPKDQSIQPLVSTVAKAMNLSPEGHADPDLKAILGGLASASQGIGTIRTKSSSAHGKGRKNYRLEERHARLAIGAATTIGIFLIETFQARFAITNAISELTLQSVLSTILSSRQPFHGKLDMLDFLSRIFLLDKMPSTDGRFKTAREDIIQHMIANADWDEGFLLSEYLNLEQCDDEIFMKFVCQVLHPVAIIDDPSATKLSDTMNSHLRLDGYELFAKSKISGRNVYSYKRIKI